MQYHQNQSLATALQSLQQKLQSKKFHDVIRILPELLTTFPKQADILHLGALAYKNYGDSTQAKDYFQKAIDADSNQAVIFNNYANLQKSLGELPEAVENYKKALLLDKNYVDALKNLAIALLEEKDFSGASKYIENAIRLSPSSFSLHTVQGNVLMAEDRLLEAIASYKTALQHNPRYVNALNNLGLCYKLTEQHELALQCFQQARQHAPNLAEIEFNIANTLFEKGNYQHAEQFYWSALNKKPTDVNYHNTLNEFYWQLNRKDQFGSSYKLALEHMPDDLSLQQGYGELLFSSNQFDFARKIAEKGLKAGKTSGLHHLLGKVYARDKEYQSASSEFEAGLAIKFDMDLALDAINVAIVSCDYERALSLIEKAELVSPYHQLLLAYKGTVWRLIGDERHEWLNNYADFVRPYQLPVPNGYNTIGEYLEELESVLVSMHNMKNAPLKQTLKLGSQTPGRLLHKRNPVISQFKAGLQEVVSDYVSSMRTDNSHPLLSRKSTRFEFSGSWSVKLQPNGFHVNHVHPAGWISSAFYVNVPNFSQFEQEHDNAGAIKFGETSMQLGEREEIAKIVSPSPGMLVLFPSYTWHGTVPFNADVDTFRLTAPFDVVPAK
ncbi:tetratricopeptide repeat protein [Thalassotalea euphylliae]|uniref:tetratricopeptide repeat protein n=1 Tax=Thalassotalea euphylliae TaxID=1655234 RepID=UPI003636764A